MDNRIILLNPKFEYLRTFVENIDTIFFTTGTIIHQGRNTVKVFDIDGTLINVKSYAIPNILNRFIYRWIRKTKGNRAYNHQQILQKYGFESPERIAYIEFRSFWSIGRTYFISLQCPYQRNFYEFGNAKETQYIEPIKAFAKYIATLHKANILHKDLSPGNILFEKIEDVYHFSLIDTNRMEFCPINIPKGCKNMARLWGPKSMFILLGKEYARYREADSQECIQLILSARKRFWSRFRKRHTIKYQLEL